MWWCDSCQTWVWEQICPFCKTSLEYFDENKRYKEDETEDEYSED